MKTIFTYFGKMIKTTLLFLLNFTCSIFISAQLSDTFGIPIGETEFRLIVANELEKMKMVTSSMYISTDEAIVMTRIFNTLNVYREMRVKDAPNNYGAFYEIFFRKYFFKIVEIIDGKIAKGMSYYSKKFNLYIGGLEHQNSQYFILKE